ncbi:class I SAM-dependent methyltransferase [Streptomyces sp. NBC_01471]|uniref:class I SAM-dependent methyltransferase n=1 Tax=Streptomyces sp. NBC_01471 TaxID=2903879 RepID=UPI003251219F
MSQRSGGQYTSPSLAPEAMRDPSTQQSADVYVGPLDLYADALHTEQPKLSLGYPDGRQLPLEVHRWRQAADATDEALLDHCTGPVLDVGCGPGRLLIALARRGVPALGVDVTRAAVDLATAAGATVLHASVFDPVLDEGHWQTAILADGNIGIGGDPPALLRRIRHLLAPGGTLLLETEHGDIYEQEHQVRLDDGSGRRSAPFRWARVGTTAARTISLRAGYRPRQAWSVGERNFLALTR